MRAAPVRRARCGWREEALRVSPGPGAGRRLWRPRGTVERWAGEGGTSDGGSLQGGWGLWVVGKNGRDPRLLERALALKPELFQPGFFRTSLQNRNSEEKKEGREALACLQKRG